MNEWSLAVEPLSSDEVWEPDEIELFLFSSALWLPHRIHYDRDFAREEGHRDLVIHGPLQVARLLEQVSNWIRPTGGEFVSATFRHRAPAYLGDRIRLRNEVTRTVHDEHSVDVTLNSRVVRDDGTDLTTGQVVVRIPL